MPYMLSYDAQIPPKNKSVDSYILLPDITETNKEQRYHISQTQRRMSPPSSWLTNTPSKNQHDAGVLPEGPMSESRLGGQPS
jgi:hypothetical protein